MGVALIYGTSLEKRVVAVRSNLNIYEIKPVEGETLWLSGTAVEELINLTHKFGVDPGNWPYYTFVSDNEIDIEEIKRKCSSLSVQLAIISSTEISTNMWLARIADWFAHGKIFYLTNQ